MPTLEELLSPFAQSIFAKAQALSTLPLTKAQRARMLESVSDDIKKCSNFVVPEVSRAASEAAIRLGVDLHDQCWHDQHKFDHGRTTFHFEHVVPVSTIRAACLTATSAQDILDILQVRLRVAWILKVEDQRLSDNGFRSKRTDPDAAYRQVEITLIRRHSLVEGTA